MRKSVFFLVGTFLVTLASTADAQWQQWEWTPLDGRLLVSINGGGQPGGQEIEGRFSVPRYTLGETQETAVAQAIDGGGLFDIGAAYRVRGSLGAGISYTRMSSSGAAALAGTVPHPLFTNRHRSFAQNAAGLRHRERGVHFQAIWFVPFTDRVDFAFALGPSFFSITQELVRGIFFDEVPPNFDAIDVTALDLVRQRRTAAGFNISGDMTYTITPSLGAGVLLRFTRGGAEFDLGEGQRVDVSAGHFQALVGARLRF